MKKEKTAFWDHPNNPILLGVRLKENDITLQDLARRLVHPTKRRPLSVSYMRGVIRKGIAPSGWREADFRAAVEAILKEMDVPVEGIWDPWDGDFDRALRPDGKKRKQDWEDFDRKHKGVDVHVPRQFLTPKELAHFKLRENPFEEITDYQNVWLTSHMNNLKTVILGAIDRRSILTLVGDVGAGKSTLLRHVLSGIQNDPKVRLIFPDCLNRERLDGDGLINQILRSLGVDKIPSPRVERAAMARDYLDRAIGDGVRVALVMDEAHDIPPKVLIALKRLWDSAMLYKLLAIILVGQGGERFDGKPWGLKDKILRSADLREFAERCILVDMPTPKSGHFRDYLSWRLAQVGGDVDRVFEDGAITALAERTDCLQLANNLAMKAMKVAVHKGQIKVSAEMVAK